MSSAVSGRYASRLLFRLLTRDPGDKYADPADPYAIKLGRMYQDLMFEDLRGSAPKSIARVEPNIEATVSLTAKMFLLRLGARIGGGLPTREEPESLSNSLWQTVIPDR